MTYVVIYIVTGTLIFSWTQDDLLDSANRNDLNSRGDHALVAVTAILLWPLFVVVSLYRFVKGEL